MSNCYLLSYCYKKARFIVNGHNLVEQSNKVPGNGQIAMSVNEMKTRTQNFRNKYNAIIEHKRTKIKNRNRKNDVWKKHAIDWLKMQIKEV